MMSVLTIDNGVARATAPNRRRRGEVPARTSFSGDPRPAEVDADGSVEASGGKMALLILLGPCNPSIFAHGLCAILESSGKA
ncbi:hypothetical protein BRAS3809_240010 [Bradyrhizobium sp. STM 3809]|nr:hypothetical protein BRAS3809_240010 [Bradyrhizobium sp. STM 3809]